MNQTISLKERFGPFLADGGEAMAFRVTEIEPLLAAGHSVALDLDGVRGMTDSFANALFGRLFEHLNGQMSGRLAISNYGPSNKQQILDAFAFAKKRMAVTA